MKAYKALVRFPQSVAHATLQEVRVEASTWPAAVREAVAAALKRPAVKGKQHKRIELVIDLVGEEQQ